MALGTAAESNRLPIQNYWAGITLAAITLLAALLRWSILAESLWVDELHTSWTIYDSLPDVFPRAAMGNQGPVYFVALWLWKHLAGMSEVALRLPSLLAGLALPAVVYWSVRTLDREKAGGELVALMAAFCAATDYYAVFYAQEARPYSWVMLGSVVHFTCFVQWLRSSLAKQEDSRTSWLPGIGLAVGAAGLFLLHFTTVFLFIAEAGYALLAVGSMAFRGTNGRAFRVSLSQLLLLPIVVALLCLPALPTLRLIMDRSANWSSFVGMPYGGQLLSMYLGAYAIFLVALRPVIHWFQDGDSAAAANNQSLPLAQRLGIVLAIWLFLPLTIAWLATRLDTAAIFFPRYLLMALPASWMLMGQSVRLFPNAKYQGLLAAIVLCLWCWNQPTVVEIFRPGEKPVLARNEDWRGAVQYINEHYAEMPGLIYVDAGLIEGKEAADVEKRSPDFWAYLTFPLGSIYRLPTDKVIPQEALSWDEILDSIEIYEAPGKRPFWLIRRGAGAYASGESFPPAFEHCDVVTFGRLQVFFFSKTENAEPGTSAE